MRWFVVCEVCGFRQELERRLLGPEQFSVVCHRCETVLNVQPTAEELRKAGAGNRGVW